MGYSSLSMQHLLKLEKDTRRRIIVEGHFINSAIGKQYNMLYPCILFDCSFYNIRDLKFDFAD